MRFALFTLAVAAASVAFDATAQQPAPVPPAAATAQDRLLDTAVVRAPGPGMWKVRRGDNTLWILGTVSPLPARMAWNSARMRSVVASADEVMYEPSVVVDADIGFFGKLALLPSLVGIRDLPDDAHLRDVLPPASYARWLRLKQRYIGNDGGVESWRPIFAAQKLYEEALKTRGLSTKGVVSDALGDALKARGIKGVSTAAKVKIANPKKALKEFKGTQLADVQCFDRVLDRVENDLDLLQSRADAWASGDVDTLRRLDRPEASEACENAVLSGAFAEKYGLDRLQAQATAKWLSEAEASLTKNRVTFSTLPMSELLSPTGIVSKLAARGYVVEAPMTEPAQQSVAPTAVGGAL
ncbi:TraB/GumN family protein [Cognatilysobacter terrigena]|uniref:TraB/GumN family protein n=1 Tax=Cognatilysobacter terrigena TaxID=2488749 RepID=UPI0014150F28|nr:TraB/GumN family protein [Lysobacter terrigena]